jgi:hypothetical protein
LRTRRADRAALQGGGVEVENARRALSWGALALVLAAIPALWLFSFTVDDALISIRYARHLAFGAGYRFNVDGPSTDGVTPLLWPVVLWPLARSGPLVVLARAKALGLVAWLAAAAGWGVAVGRAEAKGSAKAMAMAGLALCVPLAAHAVSGMETALATALATWATVLYRRPAAAALLAGVAASFRPEMAPWALVLGVGLALARMPRSASRPIVCGLFALFPFVACAGVRLATFGHVAPLAVLAKPSDLAHGVAYAAAAALASVGPLLACAPLAAARTKGAPLVLIVAGATHLLAIAFAGGDWMPFARLVAPVVPSLLFAAVLVSPYAHPMATSLRALAGLGLGLRVLLFAAPAARWVGPDRERLIEGVAPLLRGESHVACADVGWPSAATEASVVDLGGVTDPEIAALPGGHTSKRVDGALLLAKGTSALLLYARASDVSLDLWRDALFPRVVEARLAASDLVASHFRAAAFVPLGATGTGYYVLVAHSP